MMHPPFEKVILDGAHGPAGNRSRSSTMNVREADERKIKPRLEFFNAGALRDL
jgi:hypothetical protein